MKCIYGLFRKSCVTDSGYIPCKASGQHEIFESPLYLQHVARYRKTVAAQVKFTLSKSGKHLSSLFQHHDGPWSYGDIFSKDDALLVLQEGLIMEVFVFPGHRAFAESFYMNVDKLPLSEIRLNAKPIVKEKYRKQLSCYAGQQIGFLGLK
ncbi:MAG TPA: hypothetical protein VEB86_01640 [Chryseosolibacter sp.]|nr:hypothetical protein [Chryseosolibacter sp.]